MTDTYRNWRIDHDALAVLPEWEWQATSPDFDVDCIDGQFVAFGGHCTAAPREELIAEIDAMEDD